MRPGGGRIKGGTFENKVAKLFGDWWGKRFKRVPLSGGWAKTAVTGDIFPVGKNGGVDEAFPFSVECKKNEACDLTQLIGEPHGLIPKWWKQCSDDALQLKKASLLVFSKNHFPILAMFSPMEVTIAVANKKLAMTDFPCGLSCNGLLICLLKDFFEKITPVGIKRTPVIGGKK